MLFHMGESSSNEKPFRNEINIYVRINSLYGNYYYVMEWKRNEKENKG